MEKFVKFSLGTFYRIFYKVTIIGKEKIENANGLVISGNHLSNHDPLLFTAFFKKNIRFIAKEELFKIFFIKQALKATGAIPVKRGTFDKACITESIKSLKNGENVGIFPEGTRSKSKDLLLGESHNGASFIATRAKTKILPFAIVPMKNFRLFSEIKIIVGEEINAVDGFMSENQEEVISLEKNILIIVVFSVYHIKQRQDRTIVKPKEKLSIWNVYKTLKPPVKAEGPLF